MRTFSSLRISNASASLPGVWTDLERALSRSVYTRRMGIKMKRKAYVLIMIQILLIATVRVHELCVHSTLS